MRNENQLIWEAFDTSLNESRRTPEETERLQRNLERYQYLMSAQEQGEGDYFDWSEFEDYSDYEDEIEALEKEAEANGYLDQLKRNADSDVRRERRDAHMNDDPLEDKAYQVKDHRLTKAGKLNKQDVETMKKGLKGRRARYSVKGMEKPNLPEDAESSMGMIEKGKIESIVHNYSEYGVIDEVEKMIEDIKELVKQEIRDCAEHVDDAVNCIDNL